MFLRCPFCKSPTKFRSAENATLVINGDPVCHRVLCREKAEGVIDAQSTQKTLELGIGFTAEMFQLPLRLNPG
jgi:hypothetical protein